MKTALMKQKILFLAWWFVLGCMEPDQAEESGRFLVNVDESDGGVKNNGFPSVSDFSARGAFQTLIEVSEDSDCTIYRPQILGENGLKHPVVIWGNATTASVERYDQGLDHLASHGFIVTAANGMMLGSGQEMLDCLEYVLDQNLRPGPYQGHVAVDRVGATGHSQGAGGAVMTATDPRVSTTAPMATWTGFSDTSVYADISGSMFIQNCERDSMATREIAQPIFDALTVVFWGTLAGKSHDEPFSDFGAHRAPTTAWFRWQLMDDQKASTYFIGPFCSLCFSASGWEDIYRKGIETGPVEYDLF